MQNVRHIICAFQVVELSFAVKISTASVKISNEKISSDSYPHVPSASCLPHTDVSEDFLQYYNAPFASTPAGFMTI